MRTEQKSNSFIFEATPLILDFTFDCVATSDAHSMHVASSVMQLTWILSRHKTCTIQPVRQRLRIPGPVVISLGEPYER